MLSSWARIARTWATNACAGRLSPSGPSQPNTGISRRNERGPITHRAASLDIPPMPCSVAAAAQLSSSSRRHWWLRPAVHTSPSDSTRCGWRTASSNDSAPPIDAPTTWACSTWQASSTAAASSAIASRL